MYIFILLLKKFDMQNLVEQIFFSQWICDSLFGKHPILIDYFIKIAVNTKYLLGLTSNNQICLFQDEPSEAEIMCGSIHPHR